MRISHLLLQELVEKGFTVIDGKVFSKNKEISIRKDKNGYSIFGHRMKDGKTRIGYVHKLVAYIKFGNKLFEEGIQVRHKDGNCKNNSFENILIGTASENQMDKLPLVRRNASLIATSFVKVHPHKEIIKRRKEGATYKELMKEFNISSKGTLSFIINNSIDNLTCGGNLANTASCHDAAEIGNK